MNHMLLSSPLADLALVAVLGGTVACIRGAKERERIFAAGILLGGVAWLLGFEIVALVVASIGAVGWILARLSTR